MGYTGAPQITALGGLAACFQRIQRVGYREAASIFDVTWLQHNVGVDLLSVSQKHTRHFGGSSLTNQHHLKMYWPATFERLQYFNLTLSGSRLAFMARRTPINIATLPVHAAWNTGVILDGGRPEVPPALSRLSSRVRSSGERADRHCQSDGGSPRTMASTSGGNACGTPADTVQSRGTRETDHYVVEPWEWAVRKESRTKGGLEGEPMPIKNHF